MSLQFTFTLDSYNDNEVDKFRVWRLHESYQCGFLIVSDKKSAGIRMRRLVFVRAGRDKGIAFETLE